MNQREELLVDNNLRSIYGLFSQWEQAHVVKNNDYLMTLTDVDSLLFNGLFSIKSTNLTTIDIDDLVEQSNKPLSSILYWESPLANTNAEQLTKFTLVDSSPAMFLSKNNLTKPNQFNQNVVVKTVSTDSELTEFCHTLKSGYDLSDNEHLGFYDFYQTIGLDSELTHYLAYVDGKAVGTVSTFINNGVIGIYSVSTIDEMRKRGIASTIMYQVLNKCFSKYENAVLISSALGRGVYQSLGFGVVGYYKQYIYSLNHAEDKQRAA